MGRRLLTAAVLVCAAPPAAAAKFTMQLTANPAQQLRMENGIGALDSHMANSSVRLIQTEGDLKKRASIQVLVMNQGGRSFNFGPENLTAKLADGTAVIIVTYDQLVREEKRRQAWAAVAAGIAAAGNSMSAANSGYYSGRATYQGSTYGTFGTTPFISSTYGTATVSGYNSGQAQIAQSIAQQQNQANFSRLADQNAAKLGALKSYVRTTTIDPQQMFGGSIMFELPKSVHKGKGDVPVSFVVTVDGEEHKFDALLKRK